MKRKLLKRQARAVATITSHGKKRSKKLLEDIFSAAMTSPEADSWTGHQRAEAMRLFSNINLVLD